MSCGACPCTQASPSARRRLPLLAGKPPWCANPPLCEESAQEAIRKNIIIANVQAFITAAVAKPSSAPPPPCPPPPPPNPVWGAGPALWWRPAAPLRAAPRPVERCGLRAGLRLEDFGGGDFCWRACCPLAANFSGWEGRPPKEERMVPEWGNSLPTGTVAAVLPPRSRGGLGLRAARKTGAKSLGDGSGLRCRGAALLCVSPACCNVGGPFGYRTRPGFSQRRCGDPALGGEGESRNPAAHCCSWKFPMPRGSWWILPGSNSMPSSGSCGEGRGALQGDLGLDTSASAEASTGGGCIESARGEPCRPEGLSESAGRTWFCTSALGCASRTANS
mmetsp:Transcript_158883/g.509508  ORF Transcript_158883/g.509508 Transcript_158883/m.509508 type:complete len:334 (-) Transcript_158883:296-1297(-)